MAVNECTEYPVKWDYQNSSDYLWNNENSFGSFFHSFDQCRIDEHAQQSKIKLFRYWRKVPADYPNKHNYQIRII